MNEFMLPQKIQTKILICYVYVIILLIFLKMKILIKINIFICNILNNSEYTNYMREFNAQNTRFMVDGQHRQSRTFRVKKINNPNPG